MKRVDYIEALPTTNIDAARRPEEKALSSIKAEEFPRS
jgi:hypothetical protein